MKLSLYNSALNIIDERDNSKIFRDGFCSFCYTQLSDDITILKKDKCTPFFDRTANINEIKEVNNGFKLSSSEIGASVLVTERNGVINFKLDCENPTVSEIGINLKLNFLGQKNSDSQKQYLCNSPFISGELKTFFFTRFDGNNLGLFSSANDGFKIDYSPFLCGHYILNVKFFGSLDKAFNSTKKDKKLEFSLFETETYIDFLTKINELTFLPMLYYSKSSFLPTETVKINVIGEINELKLNNNFMPVKAKNEIIDLKISDLGLCEITPLLNGKSGGKATVFIYDNLEKLFKASMDSVSKADLMKTDCNLCEHQNWATAMLKYMNRFGGNDYSEKVKQLLNIVMTSDEKTAVQRVTIFQKERENFPAYHIFNSSRLQEQFFGVSLLMEAYKHFKDKTYLNYAINSLNTLIDNYQLENGMIERTNEWLKEDYCTVTAPIITIIDMANLLLKEKDDNCKKYFLSAKKLADYIYKRGFHFPTEGGKNMEVQEEIEEGSISCSALSLLYYCKNVEPNNEYLLRAKELLDLHDAFVIKAPHPCMFSSTLRWWETCWEGDENGPAICCGHGWTIWRAEADYLFYELTKNEQYLLKAQNGFFTNFAKINSKGESYAIYQPDMFPGGGLTDTPNKNSFTASNGFPKTTDSGMSRYVWVRANEYFFNK